MCCDQLVVHTYHYTIAYKSASRLGFASLYHKPKVLVGTSGVHTSWWYSQCTES